MDINYTKIPDHLTGFIHNKKFTKSAKWTEGRLLYLTKDYIDPKDPLDYSKYLIKNELFTIIENGFYEYLVNEKNQVIKSIDKIEWCQIEFDVDADEKLQDCLDGFVKVADLRL